MSSLSILHTPGVALLALAATLGLTLSGCASAPVPDEQMAVATAAVGRASTASTGEAAPVELRLATDKLARARAAKAAGQPELAIRLAEQATLDAQVAELHAQTVKAREAARESEAAAVALRAEINRKAGR
jgi:predicted component of type VI protein secretion system